MLIRKPARLIRDTAYSEASEILTDGMETIACQGTVRPPLRRPRFPVYFSRMTGVFEAVLSAEHTCESCSFHKQLSSASTNNSRTDSRRGRMPGISSRNVEFTHAKFHFAI